ncbi:hypothetical protein C8F01DRAFT_1377937 [Mycena amicta]|nr:hypothetical protein C8F01DRAFT_1377937 [Mycena amicta]
MVETDLCALIFQRRVTALKDIVANQPPHSPDKNALIKAYVSIAATKALEADTLRDAIDSKRPHHQVTMSAYSEFCKLWRDSSTLEAKYKRDLDRYMGQLRAADKGIHRRICNDASSKLYAARRAGYNRAAVRAVRNRKRVCAVKDRAGRGLVVMRLVGESIQRDVAHLLASELCAVDAWFYLMGRAENILTSRDWDCQCQCGWLGAIDAIRDGLELEVGDALMALQVEKHTEEEVFAN